MSRPASPPSSGPGPRLAALALALPWTLGACQIPAPGPRAPRPPLVRERSGPHELVLVPEDRLTRLEPHVWLTPPIPAGAPFERLLVSWNVDAVPPSSFAVELRVRDPDERWSPWLLVADGGPTGSRLGGRRTAFEVGRRGGGRIATDEFVGARPFSHYQARVLSRAGPVRVHRLAFSSTAADPAIPTSGAHRALAAVEYEGPRAVPARSQFEETPDLAPRVCSPTSLAMALASFEIEVPTADVAARAYDPAHDLYGNWPRSIQAAWSYGLPGVLCRLGSLEDALFEVDRGRVVVLSIAFGEGELEGAPIASTGGHLLVLVGRAEPGRVRVNDPAAPTRDEVPRTYDAGELERAWQGHGGVAYVLGR